MVVLLPPLPGAPPDGATETVPTLPDVVALPAGAEAVVAPVVAPVVWASVTGHTVVYTATTSVVTWPTGQLVTVAAHDVMV